MRAVCDYLHAGALSTCTISSSNKFILRSARHVFVCACVYMQAPFQRTQPARPSDEDQHGEGSAHPLPLLSRAVRDDRVDAKQNGQFFFSLLFLVL